MAVSEMKIIYISALQKDKQKLIEYLQRQEAVELAEYDSPDTQVFSTADFSPDIADLRSKYASAVKAMDILNEYSPEKASVFAAFEGKEFKTVAEYEAFQKDYEASLHIVEDICAGEERVIRTQDEIARLKESRESLSPWLDLQVPLNFAGTAHTSALIGALPGGFTDSELEDAITQLDADSKKFAFHIISSSKEQTCLMAVAMKSDKKELESLLERLQFSAPPMVTDMTAREKANELDALIKEKTALLETFKGDISKLSTHKKEMRFLTDYLAILLEEYQAFGQIGDSEHVFFIKGYIPSKRLEHIKGELEKGFNCAVQHDDVTEDDDVPSLLENSSFSQPLESVVASYNYPKYGGIDPAGITSIFYYFMFGLMFSDAAYGALLALGCGALLIKFKSMNKQTSKFLRLFFWCGISTLAWGVVFSSYFGDVVDVFSTAFLGRHLTIPPLWFSPLEQPMKLLLFCLAVGIVHLTAGYGVNMYLALRNKDIQGAIFDSFAPVLLLFSMLVVFMGTEMFSGLAGFALTISPSMSSACLTVAKICVLVILLTNGRESKNWVARILQGAFGLYNVLAGWISDILSYSRLLALGLATGVIGSVINTLAAMAGKGVVGIIIFLIIFAAGHAMNFGINILGSYVHSNRLEYVEFFGKFYDGGGREFRPLGLNTKYYSIREEN